MYSISKVINYMIVYVIECSRITHPNENAQLSTGLPKLNTALSFAILIPSLVGNEIALSFWI